MPGRRPAPKSQASKARAARAPAAAGARALVEAFFARCEALDPAGLGDFFTKDAVYHNMPLPAIRGKKRIGAFLGRGMKSLKGFEVEMIHIAAHGNVVLTERVDRIVFGQAAIVLPVMGVFVIEDGKFSAWRDYFDLWTFIKQMPKALPAILGEQILKLIPR